MATAAETPESELRSSGELRALGGSVFLDLKSGRVSEVNLNGNEKVTDETLGLVSSFSALTDLSLESTKVGDRGVARLAELRRLEWLNLYRTKVTDAALKTLSGIPSLTHLPLGETAVTDKGIAWLAKLPDLQYLGLRGNRISDAAMEDLVTLKSLTGLHLGGTEVTDKALPRLAELPNLEELWLSDVTISNAGIRLWLKAESRPPALKRLHLQRTQTTVEAIKALRESWLDCEIFWESDPVSSKDQVGQRKTSAKPTAMAMP